MLTKRVTFGGRVLPMLLVAPQLAITLVFFVWPASQAIYQSVMQEDPFGLKREFVGLANFERVFANEAYLESFGITAAFSLAARPCGSILKLGRPPIPPAPASASPRPRFSQPRAFADRASAPPHWYCHRARP